MDALSNGGFTVNFLAGDRAAVKQGDHVVVVSTNQYIELKARVAFGKAEAEYDAAVKAFHAPLTEAADKLTKAKDLYETLEDDTFFEVLRPAVEGVLSAEAEIIHLSKDTVVLRLIEQDKTDRLLWVGDTLEILAK